MPFNIEAAKAAGYSDAEIQAYLQKKHAPKPGGLMAGQPDEVKALGLLDPATGLKHILDRRADEEKAQRDAVPKPGDAQKTAMATMASLPGLLDDYEMTIDAFGTEYMPTTAKAMLQTKYSNLILTLKELHALGALQAPDLRIMESMIVNPTSLKEQFNPYAKERIKAQLKEIRKFAATKVGGMRDIYGANAPLRQGLEQDMLGKPLRYNPATGLVE